MTTTPNRRVIAAAAVLMQVCLGIIYAWSVFRGPLEQHYGWSKTESVAPYRWSILFFTLAMIMAGYWQDRKGPRLVGTVGGLLLAAGCGLASVWGATPMGLNLTYGALGGLGVGFAYVTPIATCVKWFPDRRGFVVGLAVMGFGIGSLVFAPLLEALLGNDPSQFAVTIPRTFLLLGGLFLIAVPACARALSLPPAGWRPAGWTPPPAAQQIVDVPPEIMLKSWRFYVLWLVYYLGSAIGLTAIGESAPLVRAAAGSSAALTGGVALGIMSLFNGVGRLGWGALSDRAGKRPVVIVMFLVSAVACGLVLPGRLDVWTVLGGLCAVGFAYGGYLALMPALTAEYFGAARIGTNYGLMFTAWGVAGFTVPRWMAVVIEQRRAAGDLAGGYSDLFLTLASLAIAGVVAALLLRGSGPSRA